MAEASRLSVDGRHLAEDLGVREKTHGGAPR